MTSPGEDLWNELWSRLSRQEQTILRMTAHVATEFFEGFLIGKFHEEVSITALYNAAFAGKIKLHGGE